MNKIYFFCNNCDTTTTNTTISLKETYIFINNNEEMINLINSNYYTIVLYNNKCDNCRTTLLTCIINFRNECSDYSSNMCILYIRNSYSNYGYYTIRRKILNPFHSFNLNPNLKDEIDLFEFKRNLIPITDIDFINTVQHGSVIAINYDFNLKKLKLHNSLQQKLNNNNLEIHEISELSETPKHLTSSILYLVSRIPMIKPAIKSK